ncbi:hypothetical protein [Sphingomonas cavernae]|uniref:Transmembrane protein n=1 Tax=Sphingomonas cavernae TaxID=2320861 RepID=A0A418WQ38_9SPHN|nr:hypothetical protein [Sphingomonas cavernae]RJF93343.1 hypothetical protein D3876_03060 [Sphingomonas cavernae]
MTRALDWLARTIIVALSLIATLSIIGSIAAIPSGSIEQRLRMDMAHQPTELPDDPRSSPDTETRGGDVSRAQGTGASKLVALPPSPPRNALEPWLESITYALIAIAALLAAGVFLLWRALGHWRRLADAAEPRI